MNEYLKIIKKISNENDNIQMLSNFIMTVINLLYDLLTKTNAYSFQINDTQLIYFTIELIPGMG